jgi:hypothetical protein
MRLEGWDGNGMMDVELSPEQLIEQLRDPRATAPEELVALVDLLDSTQEPLTPEQQEEIKTTVAQLAAGMEQLRDELHMPWTAMPLKRIQALAASMAEFASTWSAYDSFMVGTFLAASARRQILDDQEHGRAPY